MRGAIAHTADEVYRELLPEQKSIARSIFLRLTTLGEGTQDTRRRAPLAELLGSGAQAAQVEAVLTRLADGRLVTAEWPSTGAAVGSGPETMYVDVTHEALIREWPRLSAWLNEDREGLRVHQRLTEAATEWDKLGRDPGLLFRGVRLAQTVEWAAAHSSDLNDLEQRFLIASQEQVDAEQREKERIQQEKEEAQQSALANATALAQEQRQRAEEQRQRAEEQRLRAEEQRLRAEEQAEAAGRLQGRNRVLRAALAAVFVVVVLAIFFAWQAQTNADLANAQLQALEGEGLVQEAEQFKAALNVTAAISSFEAAYRIDPTLIVLSEEISDTVRLAATTFVQEGEQILCRALHEQPEQCERPAAAETGAPLTAAVAIDPIYLTWAQDAAPLIVGWSSYTSPAQQQAVISATALYSQALALNPPPDTPVYVWIAPGTFEMGSTDEQCVRAGLDECPSEEQPSHPVELGGYWMQRTEVTNEQYGRCEAAGACEPPENLSWDKPRSARLPVTDVDWVQSAAYAAWAGGRLPTEAEWENGCRSADGRIFPWGDEPPATERLNYNDEIGATTEVGTYAAGANGLYDMAGNVWEWTADWYDDSYYQSSPGSNPAGPESGFSRTLRGGAWYSDVYRVRCANRLGSNPGDRIGNVGFRVVSPGS